LPILLRQTTMPQGQAYHNRLFIWEGILTFQRIGKRGSEGIKS